MTPATEARRQTLQLRQAEQRADRTPHDAAGGVDAQTEVVPQHVPGCERRRHVQCVQQLLAAVAGIGQLDPEELHEFVTDAAELDRPVAPQRRRERLVEHGRAGRRGQDLQHPRPLPAERVDAIRQRQRRVDRLEHVQLPLDEPLAGRAEQRLHVLEARPQRAQRHPGRVGDALPGRLEVTAGQQSEVGVDDRGPGALRRAPYGRRRVRVRTSGLLGRSADGGTPHPGVGGRRSAVDRRPPHRSPGWGEDQPFAGIPFGGTGPDVPLYGVTGPVLSSVVYGVPISVVVLPVIFAICTPV